MSDFENPYAAPTTESAGYVADAPGDILAGRFTRFAAAMLDGILIMLIVFPIMFATGYMTRAANQSVTVLEQLAMSLLGIVAVLLLNGYLLFSRGQTLGKLATGIQIVDHATGNLLPFLRVYVIRYLWLLPLTLLTVVIPGANDDMLVNIAALIDALLIFGVSRRCLHDYLASSKVVLYQPDRAFVDG